MERESYPTDLTDEQWKIVQPLIPPAKPGGRPRKTDVREVMNAIFYILRYSLLTMMSNDWVAPGVSCLTTFQRGKLSTPTFGNGKEMVPGSPSMTRFIMSVGYKMDEKARQSQKTQALPKDDGVTDIFSSLVKPSLFEYCPSIIFNPKSIVNLHSSIFNCLPPSPLSLCIRFEKKPRRKKVKAKPGERLVHAGVNSPTIRG